MKFFRRGQLEDKKIVAALHQAAEMFEDGAILEARGLLLNIVRAINAFEAREGQL